MLDRNQLQTLAKLRVKEAKVLIDNKLYDGAYYLLGYSIECALKACIAKQTKRHDFPEKKRVNDSYVHDLERLLEVSGLKTNYTAEAKLNREFEVNWSTVKDWDESSRYTNGKADTLVKDFYKAVTARKNGVLTWIKKFW